MKAEATDININHYVKKWSRFFRTNFIYEIQQKKNTVLEILNKRSLLRGKRRKILDAGCGLGILVKHLLREHGVWGIDLYTDVTNYLGKVAFRAGSNGKFLTLDLLRYVIPLESLSFDIVVCPHVLEHLPNEQEFLSDHNYSFLIGENEEEFTERYYSLFYC